jgi:hypothetical protein
MKWAACVFMFAAPALGLSPAPNVASAAGRPTYGTQIFTPDIARLAAEGMRCVSRGWASRVNIVCKTIMRQIVR